MNNNKKIYGDFHLHTHYSFDTRTSLKEIIKKCEEKGINCVAVCDHDTIEGALELKRIAPFKVIVGSEISSKDGHIIGLFLNKQIKHNQSAKDTIEQIHSQGGLAIAPHPFSSLAGASLQESFIKHAHLFDAVEVANSNNLLRLDDKKAFNFAKENNLLMIGGSDSHLPSGIGSNILEMDDFETPSEFLQSLKSAKIKNKLHPISYFLDMALWTVQDMAAEYLGLKSPQRGIRGQIAAGAA